jgi:hypothetical protein
VRRADSLSTHHDRPDGVAEFVQRIVNPVIASSAESRDILNEQPNGSSCPNKPQPLEPQAGVLAVKSDTFPGAGNVSAREAAGPDWLGEARPFTRETKAANPGEKVTLRVIRNIIGIEVCNVAFNDGRSGEVLTKHGTSVRIEFVEPHDVSSTQPPDRSIKAVAQFALRHGPEGSAPQGYGAGKRNPITA